MILVRLHELIETLSDQNVEDRALTAKRSRTCKICNGPAKTFGSGLTKTEYEISAICEKCQKYFYLN
jgi:hypothetical protein